MRYFCNNKIAGLTLLLELILIVALLVVIISMPVSSSYATTEEIVASEETVMIEPEPEPELPYSEEEIELIAWVTVAEAEGESELGKRLVIDTIINRVESNKFPDTVDGVIYQPNQFECMWNGRIDRSVVTDDVIELVKEEITSKTNSDVLFFRAGHYHNFGTPVIAEGNHYFSTL